MKQIITPLGKVTLAIGTVIDISRNTPLFNRAEEFSIDLSVPRLPNEKIFGYKYRLASTGKIEPLEARFLLNGREKFCGSIEIVSASYENYNLLLKGSRNDFLFRYGKERLQELVFGWQDFVPGISPPSQPTEEQMRAQMFTSLSMGDVICFPVYHSDTNTWLNRWSFDLHAFALDPGHDRAMFLRMYRAIERLFELKGYTVTENWFSVNTERKNIAIFNDNANGLSASFDIRWFFPDWTVLDFINEIEDFFPVTLFIDPRTKTVRILGDDDVLNSPPAGELKPYVERDYSIVFNEKQLGYDLKYTLPDGDDTTDNDYDYVDEAYNAEIYTVRDLPQSTIDGAVYLVLAEGNYHKAAIDDQNILTWQVIGNVALGVRVGKGETSRETKIFPLMSTTVGQSEEVDLTQQYVNPIRRMVDFSLVVPHTAKQATRWVQDLRPMMYRGMCPAYIGPGEIPEGFTYPNNNYPMAHYLNRKVDGTPWSDNGLELRWYGANGLKGQETIAFLEGADKITAKLLINQVDLEKLDTSKVYTLDGRRVIISEMVIHYAEGDILEADVVLLAEKNF